MAGKGKGMQIRGGTRGGKDQFDWEDVKVDKDRENYLGHSLKASVGRWQKGRDLTWYTKNSKVSGNTSRLKQEVAAIKRAEEEAMAAALGLKPPAPVKPKEALTQQELAEVCRRHSTDEIEGGEERIKGIGYQSRRAQAMFMGTKSTTTKEGATIFEHDAQVENDGRLKMPESRRRSSEVVTSPTTPTPSTRQQHTFEVKLPPATDAAASSSHPSLPPARDSAIKSKKKKKKLKKKHRHSSSESSSSDTEEVWREKHHKRDSSKEARKEAKRKKKRRQCDSSSEGDERTKRRQHKSHKKERPHKRSRHDSSSSDSEGHRKRKRHH